MKEKVLIVGLGEVGRALFELFKENGKFDVYGFDIDKERMSKIAGEKEIPKELDVMHICYPCFGQENFIQTTVDYIRKFNPKLTIIDSTVSPGTTQKIYDFSKKLVVHSPIRGMHKTLETMKNYIRFLCKYIGGVTEEAVDVARKHFEKLGLKVKVLRGRYAVAKVKTPDIPLKGEFIVLIKDPREITVVTEEKHLKT